MFKIRFRIVDDVKALGSLTTEVFDKEYDQILGYFQICFVTHQEGSYYHEQPLGEDEEGSELLDYWFDKMLQIIIMLEQGYEYVAFKEIETVNRWIEFTKKGDIILVNVAIEETYNNSWLITQKCSFSYIEPLDHIVSYNEFKLQVQETTEKFLRDLRKINPCLCNTQVGKLLKEKLDLISNTAAPTS